jgi:hypothetical protein
VFSFFEQNEEGCLEEIVLGEVLCSALSADEFTG